jgi:hypothetical protein
MGAGVIEKELRRQYLEKLNRVVELAIEFLGSGQWSYGSSLISEWHDQLTALGRIRNLKQVAVVLRLGWDIGDALGNYGHLEDVGNALVHVAEHYRSRFPTEVAEFRAADERIEELEGLIKKRESHDAV